jgi:hypothetical protein
MEKLGKNPKMKLQIDGKVKHMPLYVQMMTNWQEKKYLQNMIN